jgi:hypothetical protein
MPCDLTAPVSNMLARTAIDNHLLLREPFIAVSALRDRVRGITTGRI